MNERGKSRTIMVIAILVVVTAISIWLRRRDIDPKPVIEAGSATVPPAASVSDSESPSGEDKSAPHVTSAASGAQKPPDPEFQTWIKREAQELDNLKTDAVEKRRQIRAVVSKMTPQQSRQLLNIVKNPKSPAGEKILSTFLLVEGGLRTQKELADLITSPLENGEFQPHSEEEMKGIREKSLRIMAIDGLFSQARVDPSARDALARAARETADPTIRAYAEDKLRQLQ